VLSRAVPVAFAITITPFALGCALLHLTCARVAGVTRNPPEGEPKSPPSCCRSSRAVHSSYPPFAPLRHCKLWPPLLSARLLRIAPAAASSRSCRRFTLVLSNMNAVLFRRRQMIAAVELCRFTPSEGGPPFPCKLRFARRLASRSPSPQRSVSAVSARAPRLVAHPRAAAAAAAPAAATPAAEPPSVRCMCIACHAVAGALWRRRVAIA
jgi:hypothetical protein